MKVSSDQTKILIFRKGGRIPQNLNVNYYGDIVKIVNQFSYLRIVLTTVGSFSEVQETLAGQTPKALFKMNKYLYNFTELIVKHKLELFDKLTLPTLNYGSEVCIFVNIF